jgi:hypothetical protein
MTAFSAFIVGSFPIPNKPTMTPIERGHRGYQEPHSSDLKQEQNSRFAVHNCQRWLLG